MAPISRREYELVEAESSALLDVKLIIGARACRQIGLSLMSTTLSLYLSSKGFDLSDIAGVLTVRSHRSHIHHTAFGFFNILYLSFDAHQE